MSRIIKLFSGSPWRHAAFYVGDTDLNGTHQTGDTSNPMLIEAFSGHGVIATPMRYYYSGS